MPGIANETAYFFNRTIPAVAVISSGVHLPAGNWIRVVSANVAPELVESMLADVFPELKGKVLRFVTLTSEAEVKAFEQSLLPPVP